MLTTMTRAVTRTMTGSSICRRPFFSMRLMNSGYASAKTSSEKSQ